MSNTETYTMKKEGDFYTTKVNGIKFAFRKWSWGEKNSLSVSCGAINPLSGEVMFDNGRFNMGLMEKTVYKIEENKILPMSNEEISKLDGQLGDKLFHITQKINLVQTVETVNL